jgi:SAM-dependent methyltransferase
VNPLAADFWDEKFRRFPDEYGIEPNDFLRLAAAQLPRGSSVLSLGEGEGRNALHLLKSGHSVTCVDFSAVARERALGYFESARQRGQIPAACKWEYLVLDLERELPAGHWDGVVAIWCHLPPVAREKVHRSLPVWLRKGGIYIAENYAPDQLKFKTGGPPEIELLHDPQILRQEIPISCEIFQKAERMINEGSRHQGMSATLQIVARNT